MKGSPRRRPRRALPEPTAHEHRSILAFRQPDGSIKGVGVHYDGDPGTMLPELQALLKRDGYITVADGILAHPDWASIEAGDAKDPSSTADNPRYRRGHGRWFN